MRKELERDPSWLHILASPALALGTAEWEEAPASAGFACSYQVHSLVIDILDLKFSLESGLSSQSSFNGMLVFTPAVIASTDALLLASL